MNLRMREHSVFNIWPSFTDVAIAMLLIFIFFIFIQFIANSKALVQIRIERKQRVMEKAFQEEFPNEIAAKEIRIIPDGNLQRITFSDYILFDSGQAVLKERGKEILRQVGRLFLQYRYIIKEGKRQELYKEIHIDGHTDNVPINTEQFPSNWELSSARAMAVVRFFHDEIASFKITEQSLENLKSEDVPDDVLKKLQSFKNQEVTGEEKFLRKLKEAIGDEQTDRFKSLFLKHADATRIPPHLLSATGYGEYQPVAPNDTKENKAKNRRIEIVLVYSEKPPTKKNTNTVRPIAQLYINARPWAEVFVNGEPKGIAPLTLSNVSPNAIIKLKYQNQEQTFKVEELNGNSLSFDFLNLNHENQ